MNSITRLLYLRITIGRIIKMKAMKKPLIKAPVVVKDLEQLPFRIDHIKCSNCGKIQTAKVIETYPWDTYIHNCVACQHTITESDWDSVQ